MNISTVSTCTTNTAAAQIGQQRPPRRGGPDIDTAMKPVAEKLGMSVDELKSSLSSGTTLDQLATSKGVSHTDLVAAIKEGLEAARPVDAPNGVFDVDAMAESIASGARPQGPAGPPPPPPPAHGTNTADTSALDAVSSLLKMSQDDLISALTDGTSLSDLAQQQGVTQSALLDALGRGMVVNTTM